MNFLQSDSDEANYRHKKFDKGSRVRRDSDMDDESTKGAADSAPERTTTPNSVHTDSNCSSDYAGFAKQRPYAISTPISRKRTHSEDSGFALTPKKLDNANDNNNESTGNISPQDKATGNRLLRVALKRRRVASLAAPTMATALPATETPPTMAAAATPVDPALAGAAMPRISDETLANICKYHGNMVRKFPKIERTAKDQERRNKNTIACRMSRRVKKLEHIATEEQYKEFSEQYVELVEDSMRATAYLKQLMKLSRMVGAHEQARTIAAKCQEFQLEFGYDKVRGSNAKGCGAVHDEQLKQKKQPFSIEYLVGKRTV